MNSCLVYGRRLVARCCLLCGAMSGEQALCGACDAALPRLPAPLCRRCASPVPDGSLCGACLASPPRFDRLIVPFSYVFPVDALVHALKYGGRLVVSHLLAWALARMIDERVDLLVPMPLSEARLRQRGFNQAQELARYLGRATRTPVAPALCRRVNDTVPQATLPWKERRQNVRGAFVCDAAIDGLHVAVVDDVVTTGSTLDELSRVLKRAGAARVSGWCAARALKHSVAVLGGV